MSFPGSGWEGGSYENEDMTFMEIPSSAVSSMSFPGPGREGGC